MLELCPATYTTAGATTFYRFAATTANFADAAIDCNDDDDGAPYLLHTHLVVFGDETERMFLDAQGFSGNRWAGLWDPDANGTYEWVTAENTLGYPAGDTGNTGQFPWAGGQPSGGNEHCVRLKGGYDIEDKPCTDLYTFICECDAFLPL